MTKTQQKQIDFLRKLESNEVLGSPYVFWADCKDCKEGKEFFSVDGTRAFLRNHENHRTWIQFGGKVNSLTYKR